MMPMEMRPLPDINAECQAQVNDLVDRFNSGGWAIAWAQRCKLANKEFEEDRAKDKDAIRG